MTTVLIADADPTVAEVLSDYLEADGYHALVASDGTSTATLATTHRLDLALVDTALPGIGGLELTSLLLAEDVPVIIISARGREEDRLAGLALGADDYITKPFSPREVIARVRAVLRRASRERVEGTVIRVGEMTVDCERREVHAEDGLVELTKTEFDIVQTLAIIPGRVCTRLELLHEEADQVPEGYERAVDAHVKNIRRKLGEHSRHHIKTVFGVGYKLEA